MLTRSVREVGHADSDLRLFLNGDLQFSSVDEYRYHEALVHPAMRGPRGEVLVLGAGDGLAVREILRYPDVRRVTVVDLDPAVVALARREPQLRALNGGSFDDPRVRVVNTDAFGWLRAAAERFDVVVADLPDPDETATAKLYTVEFYALVRSVLAEGGRLVVQSGSPYFAPRSYWSIEASVAGAGFATVPYHVDVPSVRRLGVRARRAGGHPAGAGAARRRAPAAFPEPAVMRAAADFPADRGRLDVPASTLLRPRVLEYARAEWRGY